MPEPQVKGLPEGVDWAGDFLPTTENDFELISDGGVKAIYRGIRIGAAAGIKVKPAEGYVFVLDGKHEDLFDIRTYANVAGRPSCVVTKVIAEQTVTVTAMFKVGNAFDEANLEAAIQTIPKMPGYLSHLVRCTAPTNGTGAAQEPEATDG